MITRCHLRHFFAACTSLFALLAWNTASAADAYPARPIRLLVPFAPGGGADTLARIITPRLSESMSQQWVVDNRGGAAGNIAAETVARATPRSTSCSTWLESAPSATRIPISDARRATPYATTPKIPVAETASAITEKIPRSVAPNRCGMSAASSWSATNRPS